MSDGFSYAIHTTRGGGPLRYCASCNAMVSLDDEREAWSPQLRVIIVTSAGRCAHCGCRYFRRIDDAPRWKLTPFDALLLRDLCGGIEPT